ncbi:beta/gamma crystallin-related protein [Floridanema aerugineum]|uniref:Beta/gamma crystallin-related protein n=1 Tax=Floridaenema aerugineum BLCC-F46 TaxID=3153654 RepID=A0ABV4XAY1_9CYAN
MKSNQHEQLLTELITEFETFAFTELDNETSATIQGGWNMQVFDNDDFTGLLGSFNYGGKRQLIHNDQISSIIIRSGQWRFYKDRDFKGAAYTLGSLANGQPAYYKLGPGTQYLNNQISSFQQVG